MNNAINTDPHIPATRFFTELEAGWNTADGERFGAQFADVTDFVHIRGGHLHGGPAIIASAHQKIFDTIYRGSTNRITLDRVREITPGCLLVHATSTLDAPSGPLSGAHQAKMTALLVQHDNTWKATAIHNTLIVN